ncbi:MAG: sigma-70 family RNA polymerase sigma factor [Armatimonadetes bacterium]|nr:sigma-70 family RNA polymerase sigma factor [Armatimonadota bacterium]MDW8028931.1 sigma-70 family RNA polymerase sigma factor [Armatimonadota bacterium]
MKGFLKKICKPLRKQLKPILCPSGRGFDCLAVYNPAVFREGNSLYMLYRARDRSTNSTGVIGLAISTDGLYWERHSQPVLCPSNELDCHGCEDPRLVKIGKEYFLTYTGLSQKSRDNFRSHILMATSQDLLHWKKMTIHWENFPSHWQGLNLKSAALCPFKIQGNWLMFFTVVWNHWQSAIAYAVSKDGQNWSVSSPDFLLTPRRGYFDSKVVEVGAVPFIYDDAIVLIYNGKDQSTYRIGFALLSKDNPSHILWRSEKPILEPSLTWERIGLTPEVTFIAGGLLSEGEVWRLYYGAADTVVGMATEGEGFGISVDEKLLEEWLWQCIESFCRRHLTPKNFTLSEWREELIQTGWVAAVEAMEIFDEGYQVPLELFVRQRIWNALKALWRAEQERNSKALSLEELSACEDLDWQEWIAEPEREQAIDRFLVREALQKLPERERWVIERLFWDGETLDEVAKELGVSIVWVHKLKEKAIRRLREILKPSKSKPSGIKKRQT